MENLSLENQTIMGLQEISEKESSDIDGGISILGAVAKYYAISALSPAYGFAYGLGVGVGYLTR